ncbi:STM4011 family radical SAM protein [Paenibacillus massiliensis]|uniref:STM4011 family radical SAM protein n=1 Tax=Paenibacillus massiliensis TaxID=225917 RepID=UPI00048BB2E9|nr:STM4011 family radical SAM protein [Paenibacillus massiliensis]
MRATLYYRGTLSSCNYTCPYCPFSKTKDSRETLMLDRRQLAEFVDWVEAQQEHGHTLSIFFNPYGEALIHSWYREALVRLSHMPHIEKLSIQTNLSVKLDWTEQLQPGKMSFWATYHPGQTQEDHFLSQCQAIYSRGLGLSVGTVGIRQSFPAIRSLRAQLPKEVYMWVNAFKDRPHYYTPAEIEELTTLDPHFGWNVQDYPSQGKACAAGETVFYVQGNGNVKRCYKDRQVIGHLYRQGLEGLAAERSCRMKMCGCHIGYIHMKGHPIGEQFGGGLLERIPGRPIPQEDREVQQA